MLSSDFANLAAEAERMMNLGADWLHMDVMVGTNQLWQLVDRTSRASR